MRSRLYVTVECPSVRPSVPLINRQQQRYAAGLLQNAVRAEDIDRKRWIPGAQQQRRRSTGPQHGAQQQTPTVPC